MLYFYRRFAADVNTFMEKKKKNALFTAVHHNNYYGRTARYAARGIISIYYTRVFDFILDNNNIALHKAVKHLAKNETL